MHAFMETFPRSEAWAVQVTCNRIGLCKENEQSLWLSITTIALYLEKYPQIPNTSGFSRELVAQESVSQSSSSRGARGQPTLPQVTVGLEIGDVLRY